MRIERVYKDTKILKIHLPNLTILVYTTKHFTTWYSRIVKPNYSKKEIKKAETSFKLHVTYSW